MKLNTLNTIIDDVLLQIRNSHVAESEKLSRTQIEQWIHNYRALLLSQDLDKGRIINPEYIQWADPLMHVSEVSKFPGKVEWITDDSIPSVIDLNFGNGLIAIKDAFGNLIQIGTETKAKYQQYRKYTCNDYIAFVKNNKIQLVGPGYLEWIQPGFILSDPTEISNISDTCFDNNSKYPIPSDMIPALIDLIFDHEINRMLQVRSDITNDSLDNNVNEPNRIATGRGRGQNRLRSGYGN